MGEARRLVSPVAGRRATIRVTWGDRRLQAAFEREISGLTSQGQFRLQPAAAFPICSPGIYPPPDTGRPRPDTYPWSMPRADSAPILPRRSDRPGRGFERTRFGSGGEGYFRLNIGTSPQLVEAAVRSTL